MEPLLTTKEAAEYLGYTPYTLRSSRSRGTLAGSQTPPFIRLGERTVRYKKSDLEAWVEKASKK